MTEQTLPACCPEYASTGAIDLLRARDYSRLDRLDHVYLDYTGGGLYSDSQIERHNELLRTHVFGNPHSHNPTSETITGLVEHARLRVLDFFNAPHDEYAAIFTSNASAALKLVGESYPFRRGGRYLLTIDNHNSVNGVREFARARGATIRYAGIRLTDMRVVESELDEALSAAPSEAPSLFAYPAQSNFSGVQHPLEWIGKAKRLGWHVLLDAAAFVPTNQLDLSVWKPDFVTISFYKMFGYPTGVGCLLARREALRLLRRPWFAGGTITVASVQGDRHFMADGAAAFEDGTPDYLNIPAVEYGLDHLQCIGMDLIHRRAGCLTRMLLKGLGDIRHPNGRELVRIYGPLDSEMRGGTVAMNLFAADGGLIDHRDVESAASSCGISLRTGCFCNPGGGEVALEITPDELTGCFTQPEVQRTDRFTIDDFRLCVHGKGSGAVRVSVGVVSNIADVARFLAFARGFAS
ncbi:MAG TPA: aminotransferase class V-fold PLP-dependent enzyme [Bryobacteraceae bacterium]|nr:aminotransferase class V-fold PLP-dependent enzyme [Bryobacteraceae bacterium]HPT26268.1 aminotransferase class V-fold PLP-dependent enzyme [Bryobacteraceae bacterium]